jgi:hypothetical protein
VAVPRVLCHAGEVKARPSDDLQSTAFPRGGNTPMVVTAGLVSPHSVLFLYRIELGFRILYLPDLENQIGVHVVLRFFTPI